MDPGRSYHGSVSSANGSGVVLIMGVLFHCGSGGVLIMGEIFSLIGSGVVLM